ncbi:hypothetical protein VTK26DRAFT_7958 [Humicola hyalothermophila]
MTENDTAESTANTTRRYHDTSSPYVFPNDGVEHARLNAQAAMLTELIGGRPFLAPIKTVTDASKIVDVGCGTGVATLQLASLFPYASVYGLDLSPVPEATLALAPANVTWVKGNVLEAGTGAPGTEAVDQVLAPGTVDYIFSRLLFTGMNDWPRYLATAARALKPGGMIECQELYCGWLPLGHAGVTVWAGSQAAGLMVAAGLEIVSVQVFERSYVPVPTIPTSVAAARYNQEIFLPQFPEVIKRVLGYDGIVGSELQKLTEQAMRCLSEQPVEGLHNKYFPPARWDGLPARFNLDTTTDAGQQANFRGLLLSCRATYELFSSNRFAIHYGTTQSLQPFRNFTPSSVASLSSLKIVFNQTACQILTQKGCRDHCCDFPNFEGRHIKAYCDREHHEAFHDAHLRSSDLAAEVILDEWHQTAAYLASHTLPGVLELSLVCDVGQDERELARTSWAAALRACYVQVPEPATPTPSSPSNSRLLSLPQKLRLRILEYTDLVTPWKEVMWDRVGKKNRCSKMGCNAADGIPCDLLGVFFSANRLVISPYVAFDVYRALDLTAHRDPQDTEACRKAQPPRAYPADRFAASEFLREVVPAGCLGHLRFLELVFPPYNHACWPGEGHAALRDRTETLLWARARINTPALTLRLVRAGPGVVRPGYPDGAVRRPLAAILGGNGSGDDGGIAWFYADFAWPWKWTHMALERFLDPYPPRLRPAMDPVKGTAAQETGGTSRYRGSV